jgi:GNAT superfamily N-acetyltransferase
MIPVSQLNQVIEKSRGEFLLSTDPERLDLDLIHRFLTDSYWAKGISREVVARSIQNSLCFGLYAHGKQVGFARVISDFATYAYIGDVFVLESFRGLGLGKWMMESIMQHPRLQGLRRWTLLARDAHGLYAQFGFTPLRTPEKYMELHDPAVYQPIEARRTQAIISEK